MQNCSECQKSIEFVCITCQALFCKKCTTKHKGENCRLDKPQTYFLRLLAAKREKILEHFEDCNKVEKYLLILKEALNKQEVNVYTQKVIKEDVENMENYYKKVNEAKGKLEGHEEEIKKEVGIVEMFEKIKGLEDNFNVPKLNDHTKKILLVQNAYVGAAKENTEREGLKQTEHELHVCLENQIDDWINGIQESTTKYVGGLKQDMNNLKVKYKQMKQKYADEEAELMKGITEGCKVKEELEKKKEELMQENNKLLEGNEKLKKKRKEYRDMVMNEQRAKEEITEEITNQQRKLNNIIAEFGEKSKINNELEKKNNEQALNLKTITEKLNEVKGKFETQTHELERLDKKCSQKEKIINNLAKEEDDKKEEILELEWKKKDLLQEYNKLKTDVEGLKIIKEDYTKENSKLKEENLELSKQRHRLESELKGWKQKYNKESERHKK